MKKTQSWQVSKQQNCLNKIIETWKQNNLLQTIELVIDGSKSLVFSKILEKQDNSLSVKFECHRYVKGFDYKTLVVLFHPIPSYLLEKENFVVTFFGPVSCNIIRRMENVALHSYDYGCNILQCIAKTKNTVFTLDAW